MRCKLGGRWWKFFYSRKLTATYGYVHHDKKIIVVDSRHSEQELLDVTIHELLHACDSGRTIDERWINQSATDIARTMYRLGWRLSQKPQPEH